MHNALDTYTLCGHCTLGKKDGGSIFFGIPREPNTAYKVQGKPYLCNTCPCANAGHCVISRCEDFRPFLCVFKRIAQVFTRIEIEGEYTSRHFFSFSCMSLPLDSTGRYLGCHATLLPEVLRKNSNSGYPSRGRLVLIVWKGGGGWVCQTKSGRRVEWSVWLE